MAASSKRPALQRALHKEWRTDSELDEICSELLQAGIAPAQVLPLLYSEADTDAYNAKAMSHLQQVLADVPEEDRARFELRILPVGPISGFESLEVQRSVIDTTVEWLDGCFRDGSPPVVGGDMLSRVDSV